MTLRSQLLVCLVAALGSSGCADAGPPPVAAQPSARSADGAPKPAAVTLPDPATCPVGTPPAEAELPPIPALAQCATAWPAELGKTKPQRAETESGLVLVDDAGQLAALHAGAWLALEHGIQGTGHATTWLAVKLGDMGPKVALQVATSIWYSCDLDVDKPIFTLAMIPAKLPGWYVSAEPIRWLINAPIHIACGRWFHFQAFYRLVAKQELPWKEAACTVRVFAKVDPEGN